MWKEAGVRRRKETKLHTGCSSSSECDKQKSRKWCPKVHTASGQEDLQELWTPRAPYVWGPGTVLEICPRERLRDEHEKEEFWWKPEEETNTALNSADTGRERSGKDFIGHNGFRGNVLGWNFNLTLYVPHIWSKSLDFWVLPSLWGGDPVWPPFNDHSKGQLQLMFVKGLCAIETITIYIHELLYLLMFQGRIIFT